MLVLAAALALASPSRASDPQLALPVDCRVGQDCWISEYTDHDPGPGGRDYRCGPLADDKHGGTDLAISDLARMRAGVRVLAAADGIVAATQDGMQDVSVTEAGVESIKGRSCGNGVVVRHKGGWVTWYCHMKRGSIAVKKGDVVSTGHVLGMIGLSGMTQYPHLHFEARRNGERIDPFNGQPVGASCDAPVAPLWREDVLQALRYRPFTLYNVGLIDTPPDGPMIRNGDAHRTTLGTAAPALVLWVDSFGVAKGDEIHFRIIDPEGTVIYENKKVLKKKYARWYGYSGRKRRGAAWLAGTYRGDVTLTRRVGNETISNVISATVTFE